MEVSDLPHAPSSLRAQHPHCSGTMMCLTQLIIGVQGLTAGWALHFRAQCRTTAQPMEIIKKEIRKCQDNTGYLFINLAFRRTLISLPQRCFPAGGSTVTPLCRAGSLQMHLDPSRLKSMPNVLQHGTDSAEVCV